MLWYGMVWYGRSQVEPVPKTCLLFVATRFSDPFYAACMSRPLACSRYVLDGDDWLFVLLQKIAM